MRYTVKKLPYFSLLAFLLLVYVLLQGVSAKNSEGWREMIFPPLQYQQEQDLVIVLSQHLTRCLGRTMCSQRK